MGNTKKVRPTGRFGSKYGVGIRKRVSKVEDKQKAYAECPFCGFKRVRRKAAGLFACKKCDAEFTGGAYQAHTLLGKSIKKMVTQKSFSRADEVFEDTNEKTSYSDIEEEVAKGVE